MTHATAHISSVNRGHFIAVKCGQSPSAVTPVRHHVPALAPLAALPPSLLAEGGSDRHGQALGSVDQYQNPLEKFSIRVTKSDRKGFSTRALSVPVWTKSRGIFRPSMITPSATSSVLPRTRGTFGAWRWPFGFADPGGGYREDDTPRHGDYGAPTSSPPPL